MQESEFAASKFRKIHYLAGNLIYVLQSIWNLDRKNLHASCATPNVM